MDKPDFEPVTQGAVWLSSDEVVATVTRIGIELNTEPAAATSFWILAALQKMIEAQR